jgi:hypothetical protein
MNDKLKSNLILVRTFILQMLLGYTLINVPGLLLLVVTLLTLLFVYQTVLEKL